MQDETISKEETEQLGPIVTQKKLSHIPNLYIEVGGDLLSKPGALCDLIEAEGAKATIVFCNTPSDADFLEVLLRKRGQKVRKLIGHVSQAKVLTTMEQVKDGEVSVLIVTDVAAQGIRLNMFDLCIIHATHSDPEMYLERTGQAGGEGESPKKVVSLIGPLDITHFHYLKKIVEFDIQKIELPGFEQLAGARVRNLREEAQSRGALKNEKIAPIARLILEDADKEEIVAYLLQNTLEVLPALSSAAEPREVSSDEFRGGRGGDRGERGERGRGDRGDRGDRGERDRGGDRGDRGDRRDDRGGRNEHSAKWQRGDDFSDEGDDRQIPEESRRRQERFNAPAKKEIRFYLGHGSAQGFSQDSFMKLLEKHAAASVDQVKRYSEREYYSFVDFSEDTANTVLEGLKEATLQDGSPLFLRRAIFIPVPREDEGERGDEHEIGAEGEVTPTEAIATDSVKESPAETHSVDSSEDSE